MSWKQACTLTDVEPGTIREFDVEGIEILVSNIDDIFRAYPPMCPHMEEPLEDSAICKGALMTCSKHLWQWDLTSGKPIAPNENDRCMLMYETRTEGEHLMVNIEAELEYDFDDD